MKKYYYAVATRVAMRTGAGSGTTGLLWLFGDHASTALSTGLGSTSRAANPNGTSLTNGELRYKAWGEKRHPTDASAIPTTSRYTGQREQVEIGLYFYGARWYDGALGRFIEADSVVPGAGDSQAWDRCAYTLNNPLRYIDPSGHTSVCANPNTADPECAGYYKPKPVKLPGWQNSYAQVQPDLQSCFPTATAGVLSALTGKLVSAGEIDQKMEEGLWKLPAFGVPPKVQDNAINDLELEEEFSITFTAVYQSEATREDLIDNLDEGLPTIVSVAWKLTEAVGHALLVVAYYPTTEEFIFFDPATGKVITEAYFQRKYSVTFTQAWLNQPNLFIPAGSVVTIGP